MSSFVIIFFNILAPHTLFFRDPLPPNHRRFVQYYIDIEQTR